MTGVNYGPKHTSQAPFQPSLSAYLTKLLPSRSNGAILSAWSSFPGDRVRYTNRTCNPLKEEAFSPSPATHQKKRMSSLYNKPCTAGMQHAQGGSFFTITSNTPKEENILVARQTSVSRHAPCSRRKLFHHHKQHTRKGECLCCTTSPRKLACNTLKEEAFSPSPATRQNRRTALLHDKPR